MSLSIDLLRFRRQYLLLPFESPVPFEYKKINLGIYSLYAHTDLNVSVGELNDHKLILLGDLFDYINPARTNKEILELLLNFNQDQLPDRLSEYCGRFVVISVAGNAIRIIHDAATARKVYYCRHHDGICCASQPHLLAKVLNLKMTEDPEKVEFYKSEEFTRLNNSNIGDLTCYDGVFQLRANHYMDLNSGVVARYWPNKEMVIRPLQEVAEEAAHMVKGFMEAIALRYEVMLPVTCGKDSRLLLAASKDFSDRVFYYLNIEKWDTRRNSDREIPQKLLPKLGLKHHLLDPGSEIDPDFKKIFFENNPFACERYLAIIYNYHVNFPKKINLPGIFVNAAEEIWRATEIMSGPSLARTMHLDRFNFAIDYFTKWYNECRDVCIRYKVDPFYLLYWEERMGNWGTQLQLDKDIAQDEIVPFNSRLLIETMMSVQVSERQKPDFLLNLEMIRKLWPETLQFPMNPTLRYKVLAISKSLGLMKPLNFLYYNTVYFFSEKRRSSKMKEIL